MNHDFWWHLWHDPLASNPWSLGAAVLISAGLVMLVWLFPNRRRRK